MKSSYKKLGDFIKQVDIRNKNLSVNTLLGVSIEKKFIPSIANTIGTDMTSYKIVKRGQFAYGTVTSRNGDKVSIALLKECDECIISSAYIVFEIVKPDELDADYLMLLFQNPEFDRYARYNSWGSAREVFSWEELCNTEINVPSIIEQQRKIEQYNLINDEINKIEGINNVCFKLGDTYYQEIENGECETTKLCNCLSLLKDGTHNPPERVEIGIPLISGQTLENGFINYTKMTYISKENYNKIHSKYAPQENDLVLTKIGTVGKVAILRKKDIPIAIHCNSALLRFEDSKLPYNMAFWLLRSESFQQSLREQSDSSVQDFISLGDLGNIKANVPKQITNKDTSTLLSLIKFIDINSRKIEILQKLQNCFINAL